MMFQLVKTKENVDKSLHNFFISKDAKTLLFKYHEYYNAYNVNDEIRFNKVRSVSKYRMQNCFFKGSYEIHKIKIFGLKNFVLPSDND